MNRTWKGPNAVDVFRSNLSRLYEKESTTIKGGFMMQ